MHQMMNNGGMRPSKAMTNILPPVRAASISQIRKNTPIHTVLTEYFPDAFMAIAQQCQQGDTKHNPQNAGNPPFWAREKSKDHLNCVVRHAMTPNRHDEETNLPECVLWHGGRWHIASSNLSGKATTGKHRHTKIKNNE